MNPFAVLHSLDPVIATEGMVNDDGFTHPPREIACLVRESELTEILVSSGASKIIRVSVTCSPAKHRITARPANGDLYSVGWQLPVPELRSHDVMTVQGIE